VFLIGPFGVIIGAALNAGTIPAFPPQGLSLRWVVAVFAVESFRASFVLSVWLAVGSTLIALVLGVPVAYALARYPVPGKEAVRTIVTAPVVVPGIIVGLALLRHAVVPLGVPVIEALVLAHTALLLPYAVRVVSASLENLRPDIEEAAVLLGASRLGLRAGGSAQHPQRHPGRLHLGFRHLVQSGARVALPHRSRRFDASRGHAGLHGIHL
jgi:putative spermidine/putrescine transport system permease protein